MYSWNHEENEERKPERTVQTSRTCRVTPHHIEVSLEHFTFRLFTMIIDWWYMSGKRISIMPFLPREIPPSAKMMLEIRMVNKPHNTNWTDVHVIKEGAIYQPAKDDDDEMTVKDKDLKITCQLNDDVPLEKEVKKCFFKEMKYTVYLRLDLTDKTGELLVQMNLIQLELELEIMFRTKVLASVGQHGACEATASSSLDAMQADNNNSSRTSSCAEDFDDILKTIAKELHKRSDIDDLGKALGFEPADIGRYFDANQCGDYMGTVDMLRTWQQRQTESTERTALRTALLKADFRNMADKYLKTSELSW